MRWGSRDPKVRGCKHLLGVLGLSGGRINPQYICLGGRSGGLLFVAATVTFGHRASCRAEH